ncbi:Histidinol phosphatase [Polaromonas sp. OV174]|uniref:TrlF family AAA-like ATPase n=1 Tax=Polaromonas sp. OV174 TaxID=1855300 RepID=UPI0008E0E090|nr:PHP-associated domain-containing protein [Polaromonas sp. OV174]SFC11274.1 Histidinol phosphatase [Polaromonas sp. OV174]
MIHNYPGSRWWKFDFHNHTPASLDYRGDKAITPRQWLQDYLDKGIQCIVVTDHNTGDWIDKLKMELQTLKQEDAAMWGEVTLFPGMELSCNGGVHLKVILDPAKGTSDIDAIRGSVGYSGTPGDSNGVTSHSVEQVIRVIQSAGGVACAAHVDKPKGLLVAVTDHNTLQPILKLLDAVEVIDPSATCLNAHAVAFAEMAFVLGSDSHQPESIGLGYTWVKMSAPSIEGLKLALLDPESAVRRSDECANYPQQLNHPKIKSITVEKLRLRQKDPLTIRFNPSYNALIGGRGSGKSTILECLRLGLARENELLTGRSDGALKQSFENFRKEKIGRNQPGMMLHDSRITVEVSKGQGDLEERFEYLWTKRADAKFAVSVRRWDSDAWQSTQLTDEQARSNFPVKIFSQKQILALADNPQHLIQYIDDVLGGRKEAWAQSFAAKRETLNTARKRVRTLEVEIAQKPAVELQYKEASRKAKVFASSNFGDALKAYQRAGKQQRAVDGFFKELGEDVQALQTSAAEAVNLKNLVLTDFEATTPAEQAEKLATEALTQKLAGNFDQITALVASMQLDLDAAKVASGTSAWHQENIVHLDEYARIVAELKSQGITNAEDASQAVALEEKLKKQLDLFKAINTDLEQARKAVVDAQAALHQERQGLTALRQDFLNQVLVNVPALRITLNTMADAEAGAVSLREILRLETEGTFVKEIYGETDDDPPKPCGMVWDLVNPALASSVPERLQEIKQSLEEMNEQVLNTKLHGKFVKKLKEMKPEVTSVVFDELAAWFPEDAVDLQYKRDESSSFLSLQQASAGQKTAAILSFLLAHGSEPLLMDQPEDDLDNALVSQLVVTQLRKNKSRRQLIVITHNANIVVNGDAELVMPMEFVGGQIVNNTAGGLQERSVRKKVCEIMEGGEKAFEQRYKRILKDMERTA